MVSENLNFIISAQNTAMDEVSTLVAQLKVLGLIGEESFAAMSLSAQKAQLSFASASLNVDRLTQSFNGLAAAEEKDVLALAQANNALAIAAQNALAASTATEALTIAERAQAEAADFAAFGTNALAGAYGNAAREAAVFAAAQQKIAATAAAPGIAAAGRAADYAHVGTSEYQSAYLSAIAPTATVAENSLMRLSTRLSETGSQFERQGTRIRQWGMNVTMGVGLPLAAIGGISIAAATQYETAMAQIQSQTGGTAAEVKYMTDAMLDLAKVSAQGPVELAQALFSIESVGIRGSAALDAMRAATMGATAGQADMVDVTKALAAAMTSQVDAGRNAMSTMGIMNAIVEHGRLNMDDFAKSMSTGILASAKNFGVSLTGLGAAMVVLTNSGVEANSAATRLRMTFALLAAPTDKAAGVFEKIGLSHMDLANAIQKGDLVDGLTLLKEKLDAFTNDPAIKADLLTQAFGGGRSSTTIITLINQLDQVRTAYGQISADSGRLQSDFENMTKTFGYKWKNFVSNLQVDAIKLGGAMQPLAESLFKIVPFIEGLVGSFGKLPGPVQEFLKVFLLLVAAVGFVTGPLMIFIGALSTMIGFMFAGTAASLKLAASITVLRNAQGAATAVTLTYASALSVLGLALGVAMATFIIVDQIIRHTTNTDLISWLTGATKQTHLANAATAKYGDYLKLVEGITRTGVSAEEARARAIKVSMDNMVGLVDASKNIKPPEKIDWGHQNIGVSIGAAIGGWMDDSTTDWDTYSAAVARLAKNFADAGLSYTQMKGLVESPIGPQLLKTEDFAAQWFIVGEAEKEAATHARDLMHGYIRLGSLGRMPMVDEFDNLADAVDSAVDALDKINPLVEAFNIQMSVLESRKLGLEAAGISTKDIDAQIAGLNNAIQQQEAGLNAAKSMVTLYGAELDQLGMSTTDVGVATAALSGVLAGLPSAKVIEIAAKLPLEDMDRVLAFLALFSRKYSIEISLGIANLAVPLEKTLSSIPLIGRGVAETIRRTFGLPNLLPSTSNSGAGAGVASGSTPSIYDKDSGDKLNKTEFGLIELSKAFKIFTDLTGSESIPAFQAWLEMQKKLAEATDAAAVRAEQARNPLLAMAMALGAIRTHVLEANTTIGMFLRDEVYKPALNAFKSALGELFSRPSRELQELNLKKLQLERQRMLDVNAGAGKKRLEYDDKQIAAVQRQIDLIENQNAISKQMNELKDRTILAEQEILDRANILGDFINQSSVKVNQFGDSAYFLTLTAINLGNAFNEQAANIRSGGSGAVATSGGPWGFASPQQAIDYFDASRIQVSASAAKSGDININLALQGQSPEQIKQEVMNALDNALVGASYGGGYTGGGSYSPV